jgi:pantoate--beta-alanine ligase
MSDIHGANSEATAARTIDAVRTAVAVTRRAGRSIGLVPTMGALHAGHASLIAAARKETGFVVVSIFVNPTQFGPNEDFERYPRSLEEDVQVCAREGVDLIFHPEAPAMYPAGSLTVVEVKELGDVLCGASRPGHFRGVATVVTKLFNIVQPDVAYFGQKDAQQTRIIQQLVRDLHLPVAIRVCPTVREYDGLALSSRNRYLSADERRQAPVLCQALKVVEAQITQGECDARKLQELLAQRIATAPAARLDYAAIVDWETLRPIERIQGKVLIAIAVYFGATRLIDNIIWDELAE